MAKNDQLLRDLLAWANKRPWTGLGDAKDYTDGKDLLTRLRRAVNETDKAVK